MTDPVTNVEIEDVLSSIRRLVSTEGRPGSDGQGARARAAAPAEERFQDPSEGPAEELRDHEDEPAEAKAEAEGARLVLTPAQRIDEADEAEEDALSDAEAQDEGGDDDAAEDWVSATENDRDTAWENDWADDLSDDNDEPQADMTAAHGDEAAMDTVSWDAGEAEEEDDDAGYDDIRGALDGVLVHDLAGKDDLADEGDASETDRDMLYAEYGDDAGDESFQDNLSAALVAEPDEGEPDTAEADADAETPASGEIDLKQLSDRIAGFEAAIADQDGDWEPENPEDAMTGAGGRTPLPWKEFDEPEAEAAEEAAEGAVAEGETTEDAGASELEATFEAAFETEDPDPYGVEDIAEEAAAEWEDAVEETEKAETPFERISRKMETGGAAAAAQAAAGTAAASTSGEDDDDSWVSDDDVLDEDALRDMVGEIVRQELQGALGERITRNVRKLVRREIQRALTTHGIK